MNTQQKIESLLYSGDKQNIRLGLQLDKSVNEGKLTKYLSSNLVNVNFYGRNCWWVEYKGKYINPTSIPTEDLLVYNLTSNELYFCGYNTNQIPYFVFKLKHVTKFNEYSFKHPASNLDRLAKLHNLDIINIDCEKRKSIPDAILEMKSLRTLRVFNSGISINEMLEISEKAREENILFCQYDYSVGTNDMKLNITSLFINILTLVILSISPFFKLLPSLLLGFFLMLLIFRDLHIMNNNRKLIKIECPL